MPLIASKAEMVRLMSFFSSFARHRLVSSPSPIWWTPLSTLVVIGWMTGWLGCQSPNLRSLPIEHFDGSITSLAEVQQTPYAVLIFMSPECPLCENYSQVLTDLREVVASDSVAFMGIFPGQHYDKLSIQGFMARYHPPVKVLLDPEYTLTEALGARVTPEAFLLDRTGAVRYQGPIDNWIPELGVKRAVITEHYLQEAIQAVLQGKSVPPAGQAAIGCFIE